MVPPYLEAVPTDGARPGDIMMFFFMSTTTVRFDLGFYSAKAARPALESCIRADRLTFKRVLAGARLPSMSSTVSSSSSPPGR